MEGSSTTVFERSDVSLVAPASPAFGLQRKLKRTFDLIGALTFVLMFLPLLLAIATVLLIFQGRPLIYGHSRIGKGGRVFSCYKFRTMVNDSDRVLTAHLAANSLARREWESAQKLRDDPRVTPLGRTMRKLSIDEFPQFLNVLRGEMSLVGPRPIVEEESHHYGSHFDTYCSVRPGITGLWQVSGRSKTTYERRVRMDVDYVASWSLAKDLNILLRTVPAVLSSDGSF